MKFNKSLEGIVKQFLMCNQFLEAELDRVEQSYNIELRREKSGTVDKDETYYPQFDTKVRNEASRMAEHYEIFYCLERSIRELISDTMESFEGLNWWEKRVSDNIKKEVKDRIQREKDSGTTSRSSEHIDFTNFGELGEIIVTNWEAFGSIFNSKKAVSKVMANLNALRGPIAHCGILADDEVLRLRLSVRDWFRLME